MRSSPLLSKTPTYLFSCSFMLQLPVSLAGKVIIEGSSLAQAFFAREHHDFSRGRKGKQEQDNIDTACALEYLKGENGVSIHIV